MRAGIRGNAKQIIGRMERRRDAVIRELSAEAPRIGAVVSGEAKRIMQTEIYNVPIPAKAYLMPLGTGGRRSRQGIKPGDSRLGTTTKGGLGRWTRTGHLKRSELWRVRGPVVTLTNNANYAAARNALGTPGHRQIKSPGVRSVQWQQKAVLRQRAAILRMRKAALWRALTTR